MSRGGDESSKVRKRALRVLAREHPDDYLAIHEQLLPGAPSARTSREWARTRLRYRYPDRYLELYASEMCRPAASVPPGIRSKSWQRATTRLTDFYGAAYREMYEQFAGEGMTIAMAYHRAAARLREAHSDLFARLLAEEYALWLSVAAEASGGEKGSRP